MNVFKKLKTFLLRNLDRDRLDRLIELRRVEQELELQARSRIFPIVKAALVAKREHESGRLIAQELSIKVSPSDYLALCKSFNYSLLMPNAYVCGVRVVIKEGVPDMIS